MFFDGKRIAEFTCEDDAKSFRLTKTLLIFERLSRATAEGVLRDPWFGIMAGVTHELDKLFQPSVLIDTKRTIIICCDRHATFWGKRWCATCVDCYGKKWACPTLTCTVPPTQPHDARGSLPLTRSPAFVHNNRRKPHNLTRHPSPKTAARCHQIQNETCTLALVLAMWSRLDSRLLCLNHGGTTPLNLRDFSIMLPPLLLRLQSFSCMSPK